MATPISFNTEVELSSAKGTENPESIRFADLIRGYFLVQHSKVRPDNQCRSTQEEPELVTSNLKSSPEAVQNEPE